jgi:hypothetical protein
MGRVIESPDLFAARPVGERERRAAAIERSRHWLAEMQRARSRRAKDQARRLMVAALRESVS